MEILETEGYALSLEKLLIYPESRFTIVSQIYCFLKKSRSKSFVIRIPFGLEYNVIRNFFIYLDPLQLDSRETRTISYPTTTFLLKRTRKNFLLNLNLSSKNPLLSTWIPIKPSNSGILNHTLYETRFKIDLEIGGWR